MRLFKQWTDIEMEDALPLLSVKFAANPIYNKLIEENPSLTKHFCDIRKKAI